MAKTQTLHWEFPAKGFAFLRVELLFVGLLALLIFLFSYFSLEKQWFGALIFTLVFLGIYIVLSTIVYEIRQAKEKYHLTPTHLEIHKHSRNKVIKHKVPLKEIKHHRLDPFFLGGYVLTHKGKKHPLFFNNKAEVEKFGQFVKKHGKKRK